jgi:hypothetical protein
LTIERSDNIYDKSSWRKRLRNESYQYFLKIWQIHKPTTKLKSPSDTTRTLLTSLHNAWGKIRTNACTQKWKPPGFLSWSTSSFRWRRSCGRDRSQSGTVIWSKIRNAATSELWYSPSNSSECGCQRSKGQSMIHLTSYFWFDENAEFLVHIVPVALISLDDLFLILISFSSCSSRDIYSFSENNVKFLVFRLN